MRYTTQQLLNLVRNRTREALRDPHTLETGEAVAALDAFRALDNALRRGAPLPTDWGPRRNPSPVRRRSAR